MSQLIADNVDVTCYYTTKHSWRGKYKRLFSVGTKGITTYNPTTLEVTNQWPYNELAGIIAERKGKGNEFILSLRKTGKKNDTMKFSCDHREAIITQTFKLCSFGESFHKTLTFNAQKQSWNDERLFVLLKVGAGSLQQVNAATNKVLASYDYKDIEEFSEISGNPGSLLVIYKFGRMHLFFSQSAGDIIKGCIEAAMRNIGVQLKTRKQPVTMEQFANYRFGKLSDDDHVTSLAEFAVHKLTTRREEPVRRTLCLSETCILERDPATYIIVTLKPLSEIFSLVRHPKNPQHFRVEFCDGSSREFLSTDRDSLLASLLDGVRASGNRDICVKMTATNLGQRLGPLTHPVDEEVESLCLRFVAQPPTGNLFEAISRFNSCVQYSGLQWAVKQDGFFSENKEKLIVGAIQSLLEKDELDQGGVSEQHLEWQFQAFRRLVASKAGFLAFTSIPRFREILGVKVLKALKRDSDAVTHAAVDMLVALLAPMHDNYDLRQEQLNKSSLLSSKSFLETLLGKFEDRVLRGSGALVISAMLDFLSFSLCSPYSETTDGKCFDAMLMLVADRGRCLFRLFQHPSTAIVKGAGLVMKAVIEEGDSHTAARMQELALGEGALPRHLHTSMFISSADVRLMTNRQLSRHLVGLWVTGHPPAMALLKRILPAGLLTYLDSEDKVPDNEEDLLHIRDNLKSAIAQTKKQSQWRQLDRQLKQMDQLLRKQATNLKTTWRDKMGIQVQQNPQKPIVLRKRRQRIKSEANWPLFYYNFTKDHAKPNLIWNHKTREALRDALENEMRAFQVDKDLGNNVTIAWNHTEFEVQYECLSDEVKIGDYYLRLLLEEEFEEALSIKRSYEFFNDLYHRFLLSSKPAMKCMCLQAMAKVYGGCWEDIGPFNDTKYIVAMLERCSDRMERDRLILFIEKLIKHKSNMKEVIDAGGVAVLVDLLGLAHLHTSRAYVPTQRNVIEAPEPTGGGEKEWYFGNKERERLGPYSFQEMKDFWEDGTLTPKSRCWAQGMDGWRPLHAVTQLKWFVLTTGQSAMNETDLSTAVLNILLRICESYPSRDADGSVIRPIPRAKRLLSEGSCLPHCVQLLLTFDPILVEKTSVLLLEVMEDNPDVSKVYLTGVFFFILMYTGSNVRPIAKFLQYAHLKQAFRSELQATEMLSRSILGHVFPEAMIHYLENYGPDRFAETFLGEFDTPEAIWSAEMRRYMIQKLALHISDFSPRLLSNVKALYQYVPIPAISYPQLEEELFCNIYYLRNLCDETRFPDWPIKKPVAFLKDCLLAWKKEVEKTSSEMSFNDAYKALNLSKERAPYQESEVRKAYFKMAQKYHPDKNPEGRDIFEAVNKAYEFLCSKKKRVNGPDPQNLLLIIKTQSILFKRHKDELEPYKYAGYPALIKTIVMETGDDQLFSKGQPMLAEACELAFHTINCSALNAEELRRENGIQVLQVSFSRCVSTLSRSSQSSEMAVGVCAHVCRCYCVGAQFEECREIFLQDPAIVRDLCRLLYFKNLLPLCCTVTQCVSAFAIDPALQTKLFTSGALCHLLLAVFSYDFTLEESGVDKSEDSNQQEVLNKLARLSIHALSCLAGYSLGATNPLIHNPLSSLLTPYIARQLKGGKYDEVLKTLNCNTRNPYLLWDNSTRAELTDHLVAEQSSVITTGVCNEDFGVGFQFSAHAEELVIGEVFVRVYNEQPTFPIEKAELFGQQLIDYLGSQAEYLYSYITLCNQNSAFKKGVSDQRLLNCLHSLQALSNVIKNNPGTETVCIGHFKLLFSLLQVQNASEMQLMAIELLSQVTGNQACVANIADSKVTTLLLLTLEALPEGRNCVTTIVLDLASSTKVVKEILAQGGLLYLLNQFCSSTDLELRENISGLFVKLSSDKLNGPKVRIFLNKFLPPIFMDAMRDSHKVAVHMFDSDHENPELIWDGKARKRVSAVVGNMATRLFREQSKNPEVGWNLPHDFEAVFGDCDVTEVVVGGVYIRLFIAQPGWVLRNPRQFTIDIFDKFVALVSAKVVQVEALETVTQAISCLLSMQPTQCEVVASTGHIAAVFKAMAGSDDAVHKGCICVVYALSDNESCVNDFATVPSIKPLMHAMKSRADMVGQACEALHRMFERNQSAALIRQAVGAGLVARLLHLLEGFGLEGVENVAATKAQIVKCLKAMLKSLEFGEQINEELCGSRVWATYRDQNHDLFIQDRNVAGYLTGGPSVAGYITAAPKRTMPEAPPEQ